MIPNTPVAASEIQEKSEKGVWESVKDWLNDILDNKAGDHIQTDPKNNKV